MKISTKGIYALEVMADLAIHSSEEKKESLRNIAARRRLSEKYLERIVRMLKKEGLVESARGACGGYRLGKPMTEITVLEVLEAVEGSLAPVECLVKSMDCGIDCETCPTKGTWNQVWNRIKDAIKDTTMEDIVKLAIDSSQVL